MLFRAINDEDFSNIARIQMLTDYDGSEYSLLYLKGWDFFNYKSMQIAEEDGVIYLRFRPHDKFNEDGVRDGYIYLPPLCVIEKIKYAYGKIEDFCKSDVRTCTSCPLRKSTLIYWGIITSTS